MAKKEKNSENLTIEDMANFCKQKGFVFNSGNIYGGLAGFWDFGPLGVELKNNIKKHWWNFHVQQREDIVGIDGAIITHPKVWEASGHVENFVDIAVICKNCKNKFKVDESELSSARCDKCNSNDLENKGKFIPMFTTSVGPIESDSLKAYLRPETAQLIFANFKNVLDTSRMKLPFGIAQIGKSFRNEIAPRNFLFRSREFEQMEIEYFIDPAKIETCPHKIPNVEVLIYSSEMQLKNKKPVKMKISTALENKTIKLPWHAYWIAVELEWFFNLGANKNNFRIRQHLPDEKSHYATDTWDLEYNFPFGWKELQGIADRGCYDLSQHENNSKKDLKYFSEEKKKKISPIVISEPSLGVERAMLVFLFDAYRKNKKGETVLRLLPQLSPIKASIFPIIKKTQYEKISQEIFNELKKEFNVAYDKSGSIGKRYARNDEIGTPYCITIDDKSPNKKDVTIRDRDTKKQIRVKISELKETLRKLIYQEIEFEKAGKIIN
ncbi:MAG: glycine--tRNA ligase [Nanoarchaeota archaeon]